MAEPRPYEATTHLVAHLLREIESGLRRVLTVLVDEQSNTAQVENDKKHAAEIRSVLATLEIPETDQVAQLWLRLASAPGLSGRAHRDNLARPRVLNQEFRDFFDEMLSILDVVLDRFEARYARTYRLLDELLTKSNPSLKDAAELAQQVPNNLVSFTYFFEKLENPRWLGPLREKGLFRQPPNPEFDNDQNGVVVRPWPQSGYLRRMATHEPELVLSIFLEMKTENPRVHSDIIQGALDMPPLLTVNLLPGIKEWIEGQYRLFAPEVVCELMGHIAAAGYRAEALDVARLLLAVVSDQTREEEATFSSGYVLPVEARARFPDWQYEQILNKYLSNILPAVGMPAFELLCDVLDAAILLSGSSRSTASREDSSSIWRPAIENHSQNSRHGLRNLLVSSVRDAAERLAAQNPATLFELVSIFENRKWLVFERLAFHLLRLFPDAATDSISRRLMNHSYFNSPTLRHEFFLLAHCCFRQLSSTDQDTYLGWIEQGPDLAQLRRRYKDEQQGDADTVEVKSVGYANRWRRDRLAPIAADVPDTWRERYVALVEKYGEPSHPDFTSYTRLIESPLSPYTFEELQAMAPHEFVDLLVAGNSEQGQKPAFAESLASQLTQLAARDPSRIATVAQRFRDLPDVYISSLLLGLRQASEEGRAFSWSSVLRLCEWVSDQHSEDSTVTGNEGWAQDSWRFSRLLVASLLSFGLRDNALEFSLNLQMEVWRIIERLSRDSDPSTSREAYHRSRSASFTELAINAVRSEALNAVVSFAWWLRCNFEKEGSASIGADNWLAMMPEVRKVLDYHLDPTFEPSLAVRATYGKEFSSLYRLDPLWASENVVAIFPDGPNRHDAWESAWEGYIMHSRPRGVEFDVLRGQYLFAVQHLPESLSDPQSSISIDRLGEHLMVLYWVGKLNFEDPDNLLTLFLSRAPEQCRAHAIRFVGRSLEHTENAIEAEVLDRLKRLWTHRLRTGRESGSSATHTRDYAEFGGWFASGKFDDSWALGCLEETLKLCGSVEPEHEVVDRLAVIATGMPAAAVECLSLIIEGDREGWHASLWSTQAHSILAAALESKDPVARRKAIEVANRLTARGYLGFRDLSAAARDIVD